MTPYIKAEDLCFSYTDDETGEEKKILDHIHLEIEKGSFVALLGRNGSGKSTLSKLLNMLLTPTSGRILIDGKEITDPSLSEDELYEIRRKIGIVFQNPDNQLVATVVEEDVAFGPENLGIPSEEIRARVDKAMELLGISDLARQSPAHLSGGQKQRVAVAGIVAMSPDCIIFDESTAMLDPSGRKEVMSAVKMLHDEKSITVLLITHNMDEAAEAERVLVLSDGKFVLDGSPEEVFSKADVLRQAGLEQPQPSALITKLREGGMPIAGDALTPSDTAALLLQYYQKEPKT